jgi:hypothetical protein
MLDYQRLSPFKIIVQVNPISYPLELLPTMHIHPVFHVSLLEPYKKSQIPNQIPPPPLPVEIDHDVEYEVDFGFTPSTLALGIFHLLEGLWYQRTHLGTFIQLPEYIRQNLRV